MMDLDDIMDQETFVDEDTGQALEFNREKEADGFIFGEDEDVMEFQDPDTGGRRTFALSDVNEKLKPKDF